MVAGVIKKQKGGSSQSMNAGEIAVTPNQSGQKQFPRRPLLYLEVNGEVDVVAVATVVAVRITQVGQGRGLLTTCRRKGGGERGVSAVKRKG